MLGGHNGQAAPRQAVAGTFPPFFGGYVQAEFFGRGTKNTTEAVCAS